MPCILLPKLAHEPLFLDPHLASVSTDEQRQSKQSAYLVSRQRCAQERQHQPAVDRMPDQSVWSAANKLVLNLDIDGATPVLSQVNTCLHGESQAQHLERHPDRESDEPIRQE